MRNILLTKTQYTPSLLIRFLRNCDHLISANSIHANLIKPGLLNYTIATNHLINCYIKLNQTALAEKLFDEMPEPNVVSWTSRMSGYVDLGRPNFSLLLYNRMLRTSTLPNAFTFSTVVNSCSSLADFKTGKKVHAHVVIFGFQCNVVVCSSLVDMYGKCNYVDVARRVFDFMGFRNVVCWSSLIAGYAQNGRALEALEVFREFRCSTHERGNEYMMASVIGACASLGKLVLGKVAHGAVVRRGYVVNDVVASVLVDMYAKCGCFAYSNRVFREIANPSVIPYTSMILSAAKCGLGEVSLKLFDEMIDRNIRPNDVTFVGVLHACSHAGLVNEGLEHFNSMHKKHGVMPGAKHYTCVVDMLSRVGRLDEAYQLAKSVRTNSLEEGALLWCTLLSASKLQGRVDIATEACKWLVESNQQVASAYVTLSNTYAVAGQWDTAQSLWYKMKHTGVRKEPGCSWMEIKH